MDASTTLPLQTVAPGMPAASKALTCQSGRADGTLTRRAADDVGAKSRTNCQHRLNVRLDWLRLFYRLLRKKIWPQRFLTGIAMGTG